MSKTTIGVMGALSAIAAGPAMAAQPAPRPAASTAASYAELLQPAPDAVRQLKIAEAEDASRPPRLIKAQFVDHHHHHHHHRARRARRAIRHILRPQHHHHSHDHHDHH